MNLRSMSEAEFGLWAPRSRESYAHEKMKANGLTEAEAKKIAEDDFNRLLPNGLNSEDHFLFHAIDENNNILGYAWFCIRGAADNRRAFVCDVLIESTWRGKGFGRELMTLLEHEVKKHGLSRIGLHVFGNNSTAIKLYQSLGYLTTDLVMEKYLND